MLITLKPDAPLSTRSALIAAAQERGLSAHTMPDGRGGQVIGIPGVLPADTLERPGISRVQATHKPYMLASLDARERSEVRVGDVAIGNGQPVIMAGPCSVEDEDATIDVALAVKKAGATILRGGAFKPRSSPYSFQGHGEFGLQHLAAARDVTGLPIVTEVMEPEQVDLVGRYADMLQIGSRNMANFPLLKRVGRSSLPVLLKRGFASTLEEFLMSAEYIMAHGNPNVVLCERGIRAFDAAFRFNLDLNVVPAIREVSHLPVIVDPCHGTGRRSLVARMAMAGIGAGADGLMVEVHPNPDAALSDGFQTVTPAELHRIHRFGMAVHAALDGLDLADDAATVPAVATLDLESEIALTA